MGNQQGQGNKMSPQQIQKNNNPPNVELKIASLNIQLMKIIEDLKRNGYNVGEFENSFEQFERGENYEGTIDAVGNSVGVARVYEKSNDGYDVVYFGHLENNRFSRNGILLRYKNSLNYTQIYLENWKQDSEGIMKTVKNQQTLVFKGTFKCGNQPEFLDGTQTVYNETKQILIYQGTFKNNKFDGKGGKLTIPGKLTYEGDFFKNQRNGFGKQCDLQKKIVYIGQFDQDQRNGYGEITYENLNCGKLKGFWTDGFVRSGDGVYCSAEGRLLEQVNDDFMII